MTVVTFASFARELVLMRLIISHIMQHNSSCSINECWAAISSLWWCAGEAAPRRGRQAGLTYWWKRLPLLCGWTWTAWRHRQREDDDQIELCLQQHLPPFCELMQGLPFRIRPLPARCLAQHLWVPLCAVRLPRLHSSLKLQVVLNNICMSFVCCFCGLICKLS